jgi:SNF2 family DNA or RNA helicase
MHAIKEKTKEFFNPLIPRAPAAYNAPVPAPMPTANTYATTKAAPAPTFSSFGGTSGFSTINDRSNYVDLTLSNYRATENDYDPFSFIDPAKAQEDLKALFEGVIDDDEDIPRTRSRKKKNDADIESLVNKLKSLDVEQKEKLEVEEDEDDGTVEGIKVKLLPHQVEGFDWLMAKELGTSKKKGKAPKGGILADDMGLGKTLQSIALIVNNSRPKDAEFIAKRKLPAGVEKCTLVVAPLALIRQWELEIKDKVEESHSLRVVVHHGPQRTKRFADLKKYDVVITTYQILVSEFGNSSTDDNGLKVGCFGLHWYRVILDEAHTIKNRNAKATQACYALRSEYRWCLTGTPMQNNLDELQSLIKFLRIPPYDNLREFKDQIDKPMKNGRGDLALKRLRTILMTFMKRRTKDILLKEGALNPGGKPSAPGAASTTGFKVTERKIVKIAAEFSDEERRFYERLEARTDASIEQMMSGEKMNYASALVMLLRLRQACNHPKLVSGKLAKDSDALATESGPSRKADKAKLASTEVDEMADMFSSMGVTSKKCEVCQLELSKKEVEDGTLRCGDCEADLEDVVNRPKVSKDKKEKKHKHRHNKKATQQPNRKPRNRAIITDSDDEQEEQEGSWVVPKHQQVPLTLGKAGGIDDENAEGGGRWLDSDDDDDDFPDVKDLATTKKPVKLDDSDSGSESEEEDGSASDSATDSGDEVEDEFGSDEERELSTIAASTKITHLMKILGKEVAEHKFIVFSQFTSMLDLIEPFLNQKGFKFTRYDGKMKNDLREASLNRLRNDKNCRILLCSLKCGSLGLNLTAATRVVILEPFWNPVSLVDPTY